jgi:hypothetical protein
MNTYPYCNAAFRLRRDNLTDFLKKADAVLMLYLSTYSLPTYLKGAAQHREPSESDGPLSKPTGVVWGGFVTETFEHDGGRQVTVYLPLLPGNIQQDAPAFPTVRAATPLMP